MHNTLWLQAGLYCFLVFTKWFRFRDCGASQIYVERGLLLMRFYLLGYSTGVAQQVEPHNNRMYVAQKVER